MRHCLLSLAAITLLGLTSCRDSKITTYRVPKEKSPAIAAAPAAAANAPGATMANTAVTTANGPGLTWTAPAQWTAKPTSAMRKGSYAINDDSGATADLSITAFPGDVGGDLANVNRWRGQVGLAPLEASALAANSTALTTAGGDSGTWVELKGADKTILGAIVARDGVSWFFKMTAPSSVAVQNREAFEKFVRSVRF